MKTVCRRLVSGMGALALTLVVTPAALAQCGFSAKTIKPMSWSLPFAAANPTLVHAGFDDRDDHDASIVGMWHVVFTATTSNGDPIPAPGVLFDNSVVVWHSDGTEIMNSSRPAQDGNFCLGVWAQTGRFRYDLNHIPWQGNDPMGNPSGGAQLIEHVTLSEDGNHYSGSFTFTSYDTSGNPGPAFTGTMTATRITTHTKFSDLL